VKLKKELFYIVCGLYIVLSIIFLYFVQLIYWRYALDFPDWFENFETIFSAIWVCLPFLLIIWGVFLFKKR